MGRTAQLPKRHAARGAKAAEIKNVGFVGVLLVREALEHEQLLSRAHTRAEEPPTPHARCGICVRSNSSQFALPVEYGIQESVGMAFAGSIGVSAEMPDRMPFCAASRASHSKRHYPRLLRSPPQHRHRRSRHRPWAGSVGLIELLHCEPAATSKAKYQQQAHGSRAGWSIGEGASAKLVVSKREEPRRTAHAKGQCASIDVGRHDVRRRIADRMRDRSRNAVTCSPPRQIRRYQRPSSRIPVDRQIA